MKTNCSILDPNRRASQPINLDFSTVRPPKQKFRNFLNIQLFYKIYPQKITFYKWILIPKMIGVIEK